MGPNMQQNRSASQRSASSGTRLPPLLWAWLLGYALLVHTALTAEADDRSPPDPTACVEKCVTPFGDVLGRSPGNVVAFSNCRSDCVAPQNNTLDGTFTGEKWQCVEYARRWLLRKRGAVFGDVDIAADIWIKIDHLVRVHDQARLPLPARLNGSEQAPQAGDLLIYAEAFYGTGHVAVVLDIDPVARLISVGEQNFYNQPWPGTHARRIEYIEKDGQIWVLDPYLIGWKHTSR